VAAAGRQGGRKKRSHSRIVIPANARARCMLQLAFCRHCEERSDEAIQADWIASLCSQ
jgi:hypothetical protein